MTKFVKRFHTVSEYNTERNSNYIEPWVSVTDGNNDIHFNKSEEEKLKSSPITLKILSQGTVSLYYYNNDATIYYSKNGGEWTAIQQSGATIIDVNTGDNVRWKGDSYSIGMYNMNFRSTCQFTVEGNPNSLMFGEENLEDESYSTLFRSYQSLFKNCTGLTDASKLKFIKTTATEKDFKEMFYGCTSLLRGPEISHIVSMTSSSFEGMFYGCSSLVEAPDLPATVTLTSSCYKNMFYGCTSLNKVKCLATDISASNCTYNWMYGVSGTGTFYKKSGVTWPSGDSGIPTGWTVVEV